MNETKVTRVVESITTKEEKRPLFRVTDGKKEKVCADHRIENNIVIMYNEQGEEIGRNYTDGRPVPAAEINKEKIKTLWTPSGGEVKYRLNETTGEWEEV